ncbi:MAG TPA: flavodoxin-dependent (E)-4-hydroxy-3-methylbut-2-enyl-diphosphate synthase [Candidatus Dormibacteraeota bacterium]|jgi:(E)-4-hydroxy-3-methylbut-2-enyl-diphosphate synthase|nr:flavodoxin-dependent (E)-4-hydroxy-3-methylbut-2-enyl-diphosphate synthase [Candidatus Dormibacteraeota bacterium]
MSPEQLPVIGTMPASGDEHQLGEVMAITGLTPRRKTAPVRVGDVIIGGAAPIAVQSMTKTDTRDVAGTVDQIARMADAGADVVRVTCNNREAGQAMVEIVKRSRLPIIADIHFDHRLALAALDAGVHGLRLNPGNIRDRDKVVAVVTGAKERGISIRIGVNSGSLPPDEMTGAGYSGREAVEKREAADAAAHAQELVGQGEDGLEDLMQVETAPPRPPEETSERMVRAAMGHIKILESCDFGMGMIKVSLKASDVPTTLLANRKFAALSNPYPLHLGLTEAGPPPAGTVKSAVALGTLLQEGIGDTVRVSLTADPVDEIIAAKEIIKALSAHPIGPNLVACPTCGRLEIDLFKMTREIEPYMAKIKRSITVSVMGCVVNGPGEGAHADIGIAGGKGRGILYKKGQVVRSMDEAELLPAIIAELEKIAAEDEAAAAKP